MKLRTDAIEKIRDSVYDLLVMYRKGISCAITDEGGVSIALPVKIVQSGDKIDIQVGINFVKDRVKDGIVFTVSDQIEMFQDTE